MDETETTIPTISYGDGSDPHSHTEGSKMPRDGSVGQETYEAVNKLVEGGMPRTEAFVKVAEDRDAKPGTVAANYYRVARSQGSSPVRGRKPRQASGNGSEGHTEAPKAKPAARLSGDQASQLAAIIQGMVDKAVDQRFERILSR